MGRARQPGGRLNPNDHRRQHLTVDGPLEHGVSITDACIGWDETVDLLGRCAQALVAIR